MLRRFAASVLVRVAATGVVLAWPVLVAAPEAVADEGPRSGPDVAVVVTGGSGRSTAVRHGERDFVRLWRLFQPESTGTQRVPEEWADGRYPAVRLTVMWGLTGIGGWPQTHRPPGGDVAMERQDQLLLAPDGTPWIRSDPAPDVLDDDIRWHRASRPAYEEVRGAGLLDADRDSADSGIKVSEGVWWAVGGLAAGVTGTLLVRGAAARREAGPPREEPRQELIDLDL
ncbi:hypothetical protein [Streptomyces bicolor]|uniref:hypothetical protein n=1 Tax=Streptomyces bicolor TaxID=66874 RepID=UPI000AC84DED|nr:hypothetical protein [Streptomyces bicolor]